MVVDFSSLNAISYCFYQVFYYICEKFMDIFFQKKRSKKFFFSKKSLY